MSRVSSRDYPPARQGDWSDDFHGTAVADPYRWLEDPDSPETQAWVAAQNDLTASFLQAIPARERIKARLTELWDYPKYSGARKEGERYFFFKNEGLQNQSVLYMLRSLDGEPVEVLDPNTLSDDGTVALTSVVWSVDGTLLAYATSSSGSDWQEVRIRDVDGVRTYDDLVRWCKFTSIAWHPDGSGFFYNRFPEPGDVPNADQTTHNRVYWHALGTPQSADRLVYERQDAPELAFDPAVTDDGAYLILRVWHGTDPRNRFYYRALAGDGPVVRLLDDFDARYDFVGNDGSTFFFDTNFDAPRGRIIAIDVEHPERENWREVVAEQDDVIAFATMVAERLVVAYLRDVQHIVKLIGLDGTPDGEITLPDIGSVSSLSGKSTDRELFIGFDSFLQPTTLYRYDFEDRTLHPFRASPLKFDPSAFETKQVFYPSKDGTRIPMFILHRRGLDLDGGRPTVLYGYGGFGISLTPAFSPSQLVWLEEGGVYAIANLRGGGEYGETWHEAGTLERKQNVFDDFISAAEWLIANGYTTRHRLAIMGGSNGGLLVAACEVQRPDLFGAVICRVPVIDMLHYHSWTVGRYWVSDYGNAEQSPEHFAFLHAYSPLHNVKPGVAYPPTLITSADSDDRVVPAHAKKFAAALQAAHAGDNPILLRVDTKAGHGQGKPTAKVLDELADIYGFLSDMLD